MANKKKSKPEKYKDQSVRTRANKIKALEKMIEQTKKPEVKAQYEKMIREMK